MKYEYTDWGAVLSFAMGVIVIVGLLMLIIGTPIYNEHQKQQELHCHYLQGEVRDVSYQDGDYFKSGKMCVINETAYHLMWNLHVAGTVIGEDKP